MLMASLTAVCLRLFGPLISRKSNPLKAHIFFQFHGQGCSTLPTEESQESTDEMLSFEGDVAGGRAAIEDETETDTDADTDTDTDADADADAGHGTPAAASLATSLTISARHIHLAVLRQA